jgi:hypothetical protein
MMEDVRSHIVAGRNAIITAFARNHHSKDAALSGIESIAPICIALYTQASHAVSRSITMAKTWLVNRCGCDHNMNNVSRSESSEAMSVMVVMFIIPDAK